MHATFGKPFCNCTAAGFCGPTCGKTPAQCDAKNAERGGRQQQAAEAGRAQDALEASKAKCSEAGKKMLCPPLAPSSVRGTCVGAIAECFENAAELADYKSKKGSHCPAGERYCDQEGICLGRGASCAPADKCPAAKPFRCPSWACAADEAACSSATAPPACAAGEQRCPDGLCYPGQGGLKECAKLGVQWEGCPPGKMECTGWQAVVVWARRYAPPLPLAPPLPVTPLDVPAGNDASRRLRMLRANSDWVPWQRGGRACAAPRRRTARPR
eukprot:Tamp_06946.p1 GENE.Tamp_06946~~Tamp_06946.p1  ORF type:complete len:306 (+),score=47.33 Tamp_06946:108-920(+)